MLKSKGYADVFHLVDIRKFSKQPLYDEWYRLIGEARRF